MAETYIGKLSAMKVKKAIPKDKTYRLSDGYGMYLEIRPNGSKYWRLAYRYNNKQKTLALGVYPFVSLSDAREGVMKAKKLLSQNIDPNIHKRQEKAASRSNLFKDVAEEWHAKEKGRWSENHAQGVMRRLELHVLPRLGEMHIDAIKTPDVLDVIRRVESTNALDVAKRVKQFINKIYCYANQSGYTEANPASSLHNVIKTRKVQHRKAIDEEGLATFMAALEDFKGYELTKYALQLLIYTFVRPGELRSAEWKDIDIDKSQWIIPAEKMKMKEEHIVPLSTQAVSLLHTIWDKTGKYDWVFPGAHNHRKQMSENTLNFAIQKRMGFDATAHGFRATASTILNEQGFDVDVIERQLAHGERNKVRAAYNRSQYLDKRRDMMQWYSDRVDKAKSEGLRRKMTLVVAGESS